MENDTVIISKTSWHYKLLDFFGWWHPTSLCPYFWKLMWALTLVGLAIYLAMGMVLDVYVAGSPTINTIITEANEATKASMGAEYVSEHGMSPASALMIHWNITNTFLDIFLTISLVLGVVCWIGVGVSLVVTFFVGLKIAFEKLNEKTGVGTKVGHSVGRAVSRPAKATGSIFSAWYKAHKEKHCPLIEFVED
jgi:hypothetical protein